MITFSIFLYNLGIYFYYVSVKLATFFNPKAKQFIEGRKIFIEKTNRKTVWVHCASLGEFEQAVPFLEKIQKDHPHYYRVVTFFSPSGYEVKKNTSLADKVYYLPIDTKSNAQNWIKTINPSIVFFVKYEFWWHYLTQLQQAKIPTYLVSGIFRENQIFFKKHGILFKKMLSKFSHIFVQDENSKKLLLSIDCKNCSIAADSRFDRVHHIAKTKTDFPFLEQFINQQKTIIVGSSWLKDEQLFFKIKQQLSNYKIIIAPHDINQTRLKELNHNFPEAILYSNIKNAESSILQQKQIVVIDSFGILSKIYRYADIAYIGGGFGVSVHNILEAAVYNIPTLFGGNYQKAKEAHDLIVIKSAFSIENEKNLLEKIKYFENKTVYSTTQKAIKSYFEKKLGGTAKVFQKIEF